ncbi:ABC transporter ATP-binding protein [Bosea sp. TND4EK4]|uniref:ABC transporter ATP-binding protein n=1 Tax=Bosea sp. TND4EK4 TaxID=1907408 RepID=UPI000953FA19|nr:ABC transporter ATP-binding protein [Bosea sp. TND4EK4]SIR03405.1 ATP-binding cassette, subfamily B [Bosea sp. TND4EK4]
MSASRSRLSQTLLPDSPLWRLSVFLRPHRLRLAAAAGLGLLNAALATIPFLIAYRIASLALAADMAVLSAELVPLALGAATAILLRSLTASRSGMIAHEAAYDVIRDLRLALADKLTRLPLGFFSEHATGRLKTILREDVEQIEDLIAHALPDMIVALVTLLVFAAVMTWIDWRLALCLVAMIPLLVVFYRSTIRSKRGLIGEYGQVLAAFNAQAIEFARNMPALKAYGADERMRDRLIGLTERMAALNESAQAASLSSWALFLTCLRANLVLIVPVGGLLYLSGALEPGRWLLFVLMALVFNQPLLQLLYTAGPFFWKVHLAGRNIVWLLDCPELVQAAEPRKPADSSLVFENVTLRYDGREVLSDIGFSVAPGTMTALVGPSGSGKSSLARLAARFMDVQGGCVRIGGVDVREIAEADLLDQVALVFQETFLFDDGIAANIRVGRPDAGAAEVAEAARRAGVMDFAGALPAGLDTRVGENGNRLSGGQRQRVAIARALLKDAPILLLDEATASLDPETEAQVQAALAELMQGRTLLVIAHRLHTIRHADQIVFLDEGRLVAKGRHEDILLACSAYADFWARCQADEGMVPFPADHEGDLRDVLPEPAGPRRDVAEQADAPAPAAGGIAALKVLPSLLGPWRRLLARALPLLVLEAILASAAPVVALVGVIAAAAGELTLGRLAEASMILMAAFALCFGLNRASQGMLLRLQRLAVANTQKQVIIHLARLPFALLQQLGSAGLTHLVSTHLARLDFVTPPTQLVRVAVLPALALASLFWLDWRIGLAAGIGLPAFLLVLRSGDHRYRRAQAALLACRETANTAMLEQILGIGVIRAFRHGLASTSRLHRSIANEHAGSIAAARPLAWGATWGPAALECGFVAILLTASLLLVRGEIATGSGLAAILFGLLVYRPMADALDLIALGRNTGQSAQAIRSVLDQQPILEPTRDLVPQGHALSFQDVQLSRNGKTILSGFTLDIADCGLIAFVGPSGSGKTTALLAAAGFLAPDAGRITIGGIDLHAMTSARRRSLMAPVFQDTYLLRDTVRANIALGRPDADEAEIVAAARAAQAHDFIMNRPAGYATMIGESGTTLSGGERQRIALARALLCETPILIMDEGISALDPENETSIRRTLRRLARHRAVVIATHDMHLSRDADDIVLIENGTVSARGKHEEVLAESVPYRRYWRRLRPA